MGAAAADAKRRVSPAQARPYTNQDARAELTGLSVFARDARAWPFEQARSLLARVIKARIPEIRRQGELIGALLTPKGGVGAVLEAAQALGGDPVVFETGYGPSGLPHIGTFQEVARTSMVRAAFRALTEDAIATRLICFSDDMDGLRKIPPGLPNAAMLEADLHKPLGVVRDPFGEHASFAAHNNARLRGFLDGFGFDYEFMSSTEVYRSGAFDATLLRALKTFNEIQAVMLPTLGPERRATYSPFLPISPKSGRVLQTPTLDRDLEAGTITFADEDGERLTVPVTGGAVKLQWKPDWAMRWAALKIDYEMSGKDLIDSVKVSNKICKILGGLPPEGFSYELYLDEDGQKISKSKGNGLSMEDWLRYSTPESLAYYVYQSPKSAKKLSFDVIPKATDEYQQQREAFASQDAAKRLDNPIWSIHEGRTPPRGSPVSFGLMLNVVSAANAASKEVLWGFLSRYAPSATPAGEPEMDRLAGYAVNYYEDFVRPSKRFRPPDGRERRGLEELLIRLEALADDATAETIQEEVFEAGKVAAIEPLRLWFAALYEVLLGQSQGPRFGSFVAIFGLARTRDLIGRALEGADLADEARGELSPIRAALTAGAVHAG